MSSPRSIPADENLRWAFIVGAPRCGTTSLSKYLKSHPDLAFARIKEPHFFAQNDLRQVATDELREIVRHSYLDRYFRDREGASVLAEGSVTYLYFPEQMEPILRLWPRARFIIALRSPLEMIPSLHQRLIHNGDEDQREFARAWALVPERSEGRSLPSRCADPRLLDYREIGQLGKHVERFLAAVGRERCFISIFDDLARDPAGQYRQMLDFLELPTDGRTDFSANRKSKSVKSIALQRLLMRPPKRAISVLGSHNYQERFDARKPPKPIARAVLGLRRRLLKWNEAPARKTVIDDKLLTEMRDCYRDDIALLSQLVGRDLTHWIDG